MREGDNFPLYNFFRATAQVKCAPLGIDPPLLPVFLSGSGQIAPNDRNNSLVDQVKCINNGCRSSPLWRGCVGERLSAGLQRSSPHDYQSLVGFKLNKLIIYFDFTPLKSTLQYLTRFHEENIFYYGKNDKICFGCLLTLLILYIKIITEWEVSIYSVPQAWTVRAGCPANTTGEAWSLSVRIGRSRGTYTYTGTPIGSGRRVTIHVNGDWLEVTMMPESARKQAWAGCWNLLGTVILDSWGYQSRRSARLF